MKRNVSIDLFKFISAIFVIAIHTRPFHEISTFLDFYFVDVLCRLAVPFFCVCSGYYLHGRLYYDNNLVISNDENKKIITKYIFSMIKIYLLWSIIYLIFQIPNWIETGWFSLNAFVDWGVSFFLKGSYYHLWYLLCIIYALPVCYFLLKRITCNNLIVLGIGLYMIEVIEYAYRTFLPNNVQRIFKIFDIFGCIPISMTRILPFLILGIYISSKGKMNIKNSAIGFVCSYLMLSFEATKLSDLKIENVSYILLSYITAFFFFNLVININEYININCSRNLAKISTGVYCIHPLIILLAEKILGEMNNLILFIIVTIVSVLLVAVFYYMKHKIVER